jgi:hypothetical protein
MPNAAAPGRNGDRNEATAGVSPTPQNRSVGKERSAFIDSYLQAREGQPSGAVNGQVGYDAPDVTRLELYILARHDRDWMAKEVSGELRTGGWRFDNNRQSSVTELFETDSVFGDWVDSLFDQYGKKLNEIWRRIVHPKLGARSFYEDRGSSPLPTTIMPVDVVSEEEPYNRYVTPAAQLEGYLAEYYDRDVLLAAYCRMLRGIGWHYHDGTFCSFNNRFEWDYAFRTYVEYLMRRYKAYHNVIDKLARNMGQGFYPLYFRIWDRICDFLCREYPEDIDDLYDYISLAWWNTSNGVSRRALRIRMLSSLTSRPIWMRVSTVFHSLK